MCEDLGTTVKQIYKLTKTNEAIGLSLSSIGLPAQRMNMSTVICKPLYK